MAKRRTAYGGSVILGRLKRTRSKYGVDLTEEGKARRTHDGITYDSALECDYAKQLDVLLRIGHITDVKRQQRFRLMVNGVKITEYRADFVLTFPDGHDEIREVKGRMTRDAEIKLRLFRALHPEIPLEIVRTVH